MNNWNLYSSLFSLSQKYTKNEVYEVCVCVCVGCFFLCVLVIFFFGLNILIHFKLIFYNKILWCRKKCAKRALIMCVVFLCVRCVKKLPPPHPSSFPIRTGRGRGDGMEKARLVFGVDGGSSSGGSQILWLLFGLEEDFVESINIDLEWCFTGFGWWSGIRAEIGIMRTTKHKAHTKWSGKEIGGGGGLWEERTQTKKREKGLISVCQCQLEFVCSLPSGSFNRWSCWFARCSWIDQKTLHGLTI